MLLQISANVCYLHVEIPECSIIVTSSWADGVSNHQSCVCLLNRLFMCRSKKTSKLCVTAFMRGIHRSSVNSPHKWRVTRNMFPFDDVIMVLFFWSVDMTVVN